MDHREFVARLLADREGMMVITGIGSATYDVAACGDDPLHLERDGLHCDGRPGTCARAPGSPRRGDYRRRRHVDGPGQPRDHRRQAAQVSDRDRARQRPLQRQRHAVEPHLFGHRSRRRGEGVQVAGRGGVDDGSRRPDCARCWTRGPARCSFTRASMPTTRNASSRAATATASSSGSCRRRPSRLRM